MRRAGTNKLAGAVALFVLQDSKNDNDEAIPFCVRVNQRSDRLLTGRGSDAARSTSGVRQLRLPACVGLSWACAKQGGRHTADQLLARNKQRVSLQVFDLLLTGRGMSWRAQSWSKDAKKSQWHARNVQKTKTGVMRYAYPAITEN